MRLGLGSKLCLKVRHFESWIEIEASGVDYYSS